MSSSYQLLPTCSEGDRWCLWVIRAELWIVYTYAGVAKINYDWIRAEPLRHWLIKRMRFPLIGWLMQYELPVYFFSWFGLIYDLVVGTLLIHPWTFHLGLVLTLMFHMTNKYIFKKSYVQSKTLLARNQRVTDMPA